MSGTTPPPADGPDPRPTGPRSPEPSTEHASAESPSAAAAQTTPLPATPAPPAGGTPPPAGPPPTQHWAGPPPPPRRSMWGDATSTTGGKVALLAGFGALALVLLIVGGLAVAGLVRAVTDDDRGPVGWHMGVDDDDDRGEMGPGMGRGMGPGNDDSDQGFGPGNGQGNGNRNGWGMGPGMGMGGLGAFGGLHGEAVIEDGTGTRTILFQRGEVTAVTTDKVTVKSTDDFTATYTIGDDTRQRIKDKVSSLEQGDQVMVVADKDGATTLQILRLGRSG